MLGSINITLLWRIQDFPARRGDNPKDWGVNLLFWAIFPKNLLAGSPLDPPMNCYFRFIFWVRSPVIQVEVKLNSSKLHLLAVQSRSIITVTIAMISVSSLPPANEAAVRWCFHSCLSVHRREGVPIWPLPMMHWASLYRSPDPPPHPDIRYGPPPWTSDTGPPALPPLLVTSGDRYWNLFKLVHLRTHPLSPYPFTSTDISRTVSKRAVRVLLECFLLVH